ncbi:uncharacterized protein MONBRDRAFT_38331 [Monosiga brevicollis MX1]|uniref:Amino acid transporter transmembrane domain-containing protein n=1 Tax=Monosiga brevicollis TaxID=81824 RepID=A9V722_MONBE|nr:uncharacterized protein MONBRDRAFT_38331 [Monosiga brevicollis MX1]EDQ86645.1 predicted protein [Monosiga brevicollis MX1]|eukprot:XP_001748481.1 hypothetical protein [Monosiga brevicollis MX1]
MAHGGGNEAEAGNYVELSRIGEEDPYMEVHGSVPLLGAEVESDDDAPFGYAAAGVPELDGNDDLMGGASGGRPNLALHHGTNSMWATASTIVSNMIGVGVLGLPAALGALGWPLFIIILIVMTVLSSYSALILGWLKGTVTSLRGYPDLAQDAAKSHGPKHAKFFRRITQCILFAYLQGACTLYLITMKLALETVFERCPADQGPPKLTPHGAQCERPACSHRGVVDLPDSIWLLVAVVILFPFVHYRDLSRSSWLSFVGVGTILIVDVVIMIRCIQKIASDDAPNFDREWDTRSVVNALTTMVFAFGGHALIPDILSEMRFPKDFSLAVYWSQGFMFVNYLLVGCLGYAAYGADVQSPITLSLPRDGVDIFNNICLLLHVGVAYCINSTVFVRNICDTIWPGFLSEPHLERTKLQRWSALSAGVLLLSFFISVILPYFSDLMDVNSAISLFALSIWLPATLLIMSQLNRMTVWLIMFNALLVLLGVVGSLMGLWAAMDDLVDKLGHCRINFGY